MNESGCTKISLVWVGDIENHALLIRALNTLYCMHVRVQVEVLAWTVVATLSFVVGHIGAIEWLYHRTGYLMYITAVAFILVANLMIVLV